MGIFQIFYVSNAAGKPPFEGVVDFLPKAQQFNLQNEISGILLFRAGLFLQLIEGKKEVVESLFSKIGKDPRHKNVIKLFETSQNDRLFKEWSMAYREVSDLDVKMINQILSWNKLIDAASGVDNHLIMHMLGQFKTSTLKAG